MQRSWFGVSFVVLILIAGVLVWLWQGAEAGAEPVPSGGAPESGRVVPDDGRWIEAVGAGERVVLVDPKTDEELADLEVPYALPPLTPAEKEPLETFLSVSLKDALQDWERMKKQSPDTKDYALRLANAQLRLERSRAKMNAFLQGSYVVVPVGKKLPLAFWRHPDIHVTCMTAAREDGTPITVWLLTHYSRAPAFREALKVYSMERRAKVEAAAADFNALPLDRRELLLPYVVGRAATKNEYPAGVTRVERNLVKWLRKGRVRAVGKGMIELRD